MFFTLLLLAVLSVSNINMNKHMFVPHILLLSINLDYLSVQTSIVLEQEVLKSNLKWKMEFKKK